MSGEAAMKLSLRGALRDAGLTPKGVVDVGAEGGGENSEISSNRGDDGSTWRYRGGGDGV